MAAYRAITFRQLVVAADPDWVRDSIVVPEYVFGGGRGEKRERRFTASYRTRGAYAPEEE